MRRAGKQTSPLTPVVELDPLLCFDDFVRIGCLPEHLNSLARACGWTGDEDDADGDGMQLRPNAASASAASRTAAPSAEFSLRRFYIGEEPLPFSAASLLTGHPESKTDDAVAPQSTTASLLPDAAAATSFMAACAPPCSLFVIEFHRWLLPPTVTNDSSSESAAECAARATFLLLHWAQLRPLLMPSFAPGPSVISFEDWYGIRHDSALMDRVAYSYHIVLHCYGWRLHEQVSGELDRGSHWRARYAALAQAPTAYGRLTSVLRSLLEFRLLRYAAAFLAFLAEEFCQGRLRLLCAVWRTVWFEMVAGCWEREETNGKYMTAVRSDLARALSRFEARDKVDSDDE